MNEESVSLSFKRRQGTALGCLTLPLAVVFLGAAVSAAAGMMGAGLAPRLLGAAMFGFFGLLMAASSISTIRRDKGPDAVRVSPTGLWLPEMGQLPWSRILEIRLETIRSIGGGKAPVTRAIRRLGVVPADSSLRPDPSTRLTSQMVMGYLAFLRRLVPESRFGGDDPAPFGVSETEIRGSFDDVLVAVRQYATVIDEAERRAQARAARWGVELQAAPTPPIAPDRLRDLDAAIGNEPSVASGSNGAPTPSADPEPQPRATFSSPVTRPANVVAGAMRIVFPLVLLLPILGSFAGVAAGPVAFLPVVISGVILLGFVLPGVVQLRTDLRRYRGGREGGPLLRVGPDGIWLADMGLIAWERVAVIATERAGWARSSAGVRLERWRLVVEPAAGSGRGSRFGVNSDDLDARFDDVLDLIRLYHPVHEPV